MPVSEKTIERLSLYRRILREAAAEGLDYIYSHEMAERVASTAAQVRRDVMVIGYSGNSKKGYEVEGLSSAISDYLDVPGGESVALVGLGNLGSALLPFFSMHRPDLKIAACFDNDSDKVDKVFSGCRCYDTSKIDSVVRNEGIKIAVLVVPAEAAQKVADLLINAGVKGILNFAPAYLKAPENVWVEHIDMTIAIEKVSFLARRSGPGEASGRRNVSLKADRVKL